MGITDGAKDWLHINGYYIKHHKVELGLLHDIARANALDDNRKDICRNDYEAALASLSIDK